jgi:hypothetical protein
MWLHKSVNKGIHDDNNEIILKFEKYNFDLIYYKINFVTN